MRLRVLLCAALVCGVAAAPAGAVRTEVAHMPASSPEIAGDSAVFFSFTQGKARLVRAQPGTTAVTLREFPLLSGADDDECCHTELSHAFSASATRVAVSRFYQAFAKGFLAQSDYEVHAGPLGGELSQLFKCQFDHPYDVDGDRIAYSGDDCTEGTGNKASGSARRIVVRDLAAAGAPTVASIPITLIPSRVDLAGDHVAYRAAQGTGAAIFVRELGADADAYTVPTASSFWSLQPDGKLAVSHFSGEAGGCRIEWHSKAEPVAHRLEVCPLSRVVMAGDRIAFQRREATSDSLDVVGLDGSGRSVVFSEPRASFNGFDWDGARLAYGISGCLSRDDRVYFEDLTSEPPLVEGGECAVTITPKTVRASKSGLVRITVTPTDGAFGTTVLYFGKKQASTRLIPFAVISGPQSMLQRLNGVALKQLKDKGSVVLTARVAVVQRSGESKTYKRAIRVLRAKK